MILLIVAFVAGFILGVLFGRRNVSKVEKALAEAKEIYEQARQEIRKKGK